MKKSTKNIPKEFKSLVGRNLSDICFANYPFKAKRIGPFFCEKNFGERSLQETLEYFELYFDYSLSERLDEFGEYRFFDRFEKVYMEYFIEEVTNLTPLYVYSLGNFFPSDDEIVVPRLAFGLVRDFEEPYLINRYGEIIYIADYVLSLFRDEYKLFFSIDDEKYIESENLQDIYEEVYPDLVFELNHKEYLNDQGFYREIYQELIKQIF